MSRSAFLVAERCGCNERNHERDHHGRREDDPERVSQQRNCPEQYACNERCYEYVRVVSGSHVTEPILRLQGPWQRSVRPRRERLELSPLDCVRILVDPETRKDHLRLQRLTLSRQTPPTRTGIAPGDLPLPEQQREARGWIWIRLSTWSATELSEARCEGRASLRDVKIRNQFQRMCRCPLPRTIPRSPCRPCRDSRRALRRSRADIGCHAPASRNPGTGAPQCWMRVT